MPRHQTLKFNIVLKLKNVNLIKKNQSERKHFGVFIYNKLKKFNIRRRLS